MATEVDKKIVEMQLKNGQFEQASAQTMSTLDKLKAKLQFKDAAAGFSAISREAKGVNLNPIVVATESVSRGFSAMEVVAFTTFQRITNAALTAGKNIASALTTAPIITGFKEYEQKMNSIQTIWSNTRSTKGKADPAVIREINAEADAAIKAIEDVKRSGGGGGGGSGSKSSVSAETAKRHKEEQDELEANIKKQEKALAKAQTDELQNFKRLHDGKMDGYGEEYQASLAAAASGRDSQLIELDKKVAAANKLTNKTQQKNQLSLIDKQRKAVLDKYQTETDKSNILYNSQCSQETTAHEIEMMNIKNKHAAKMEGLKAEYDQVRKNLAAEQSKGSGGGGSSGGSGGGGGNGFSSSTSVQDIEARRLEQLALASENAADRVPPTMEEIKTSLEELNKYSDKTIYNFANMTENIGRFTSAGVDLDTSVKAIKGLANIGGLAGADANRVASGMYQMSQAMAGGVVMLEDWNSLENNGMGGEILINEIEAVAKEYGIAVDELKAKHGTFQKTLSTGWLTTDIFTATLERFTGDLTMEDLLGKGYAQEEAQRIYDLGKNAIDAAASVRTLTQLYDTLQEAITSGWAMTWELLIGDFEYSKELFTNISETLGGMVDDAADARNAVIKDWVDLGGREKLFDTFQKIFDNFINLATVIKDAWYDIFPPTTGQDLMNITNAFSDFIDKISFSEETLAAIGSIFKTVFATLKMGVDVIKAIGQGIIDAFDIDFDGFSISRGLSAFADGLANLNTLQLKDNVTSVFSKLGNVFKNFFETLGNFDINKAIDTIVNGITSLPEKINPVILGLFGTGFAAKGFASLFDSVKNLFKKGNLLTSFRNVIDGVSETLESFQKAIDAFAIKQIAVAIGILALSVFALSLLDGPALTQGVGALSLLIAEITVAMKVLGGLTGQMSSMASTADGAVSAFSAKSASFLGVAAALVALGVAVLALSVSAAILSVIPIDRTMANLTMLLGGLVGSCIALQKWAPNMMKSAAGLLMIAAAVTLITIPLLILGVVPFKIVTKGLIAIAAIFGIFVAFTKLVDNKKIIQSAIAIVLLAKAIELLVKPILLMGALALVAAPGILVLAAILFVLTKAADKLNSNVKGGVALIAIAVAINILAISLAILVGVVKSSTLGELFVAVLTITALVGVLVLAAKFVEKAKGGAMTLIGMALAIAVLTIPLTQLAKCEPGNIMAAAIALSLIVVACGLMANVARFGTKGAAAMVMLAASMYIMTQAIIPLTQIDPKQLLITVGILALLGLALVALGALASIGPVAMGMIVFSATLVGIGLACVLVGAGLALVGKGIQYLAQVGPEGITRIVDSICIFIDNLPRMAESFVQAFVGICDIIIQYTPVIVDSIIGVMSAVLKALWAKLGELLSTVGSLLTSAWQYIRDNAGSFFSAAGEIISQLCQGLLGGLALLLQAGWDLLVGLFDYLVESIATLGTELWEGTKEVGKNLIQGLLDGITAMASGLKESISNIGSSMLGWLKDKLGIHSPSREAYAVAEFFDQGLINGLDDGARDINESAAALGAGAIAGLNAGLASDVKGLSPEITPVMNMDTTNFDFNSLNNKLDGFNLDGGTTKLELYEEKEQHVYYHIKSDPIIVKGVNNQDEFVAVTNKTIDTDAMMRDIRRGLRK